MHYTLSVIIKDVNNLDSVLDKFDEDNECNPNPKWDWWVIGGRWSGLVVIKEECGNCIVGDRTSNEKFPRSLKYNGYKNVDGARLKDIDFSKMSSDKETFYTYALLDEFGVWHEKETFNGESWVQKEHWVDDFDDLIHNTDQNNYLIIVDYHD